MLIHDDLVFVHMKKCAGNSIKKYFRFVLNSFEIEKIMHRQAFHIPEKKRNEKYIFGSIRNPFEWYVSCYKMLLSSTSVKHKHEYFDNFLKSKMFERNKFKNNLGFFSNTFIDMFWREKFKCEVKTVMDKSKFNFFKLNENALIPQNFLHVKNLSNNKGIKKILKEVGINYSDDIDVLVINVHVEHNDYYKYYNNELIELVNKKDRFLLEYFDYSFDDILNND